MQLVQEVTNDLFADYIGGELLLTVPQSAQRVDHMRGTLTDARVTGEWVSASFRVKDWKQVNGQQNEEEIPWIALPSNSAVLLSSQVTLDADGTLLYFAPAPISGVTAILAKR